MNKHSRNTPKAQQGRLPLSLLAAALMMALGGGAFAGVIPNSFVRGTGSITQSDINTTNVTVNTANPSTPGSRASVIIWNSFDIDAGQTVNFNNATSNPLAVINYVAAGNTASQINGAINAPAVGGKNTSILVVNPYGVNIGGSAVINTSGAFIAAAGTANPEGTNGAAPSGSVSISLSQKAFVTVDSGARITTGDSQGAGDHIAFMSYGVGSLNGTPDTGENPLIINTAALPYINETGSSPWNFYTNQGVGEGGNAAVTNTGLSNYYMLGFSLAGSSAVYQFNGHQMNTLDMGFATDPDTGYFTRSYAGQGFGTMTGTADLGNATFRTALGDNAGLNVSASSINGGHFLIPDGLYDPAVPPIDPISFGLPISSFLIQVNGDLTNNTITSSAGGGPTSPAGGTNGTIVAVQHNWSNSTLNVNGGSNPYILVQGDLDSVNVNTSLDTSVPESTTFFAYGNINNLNYLGNGDVNLSMAYYGSPTEGVGNITNSTIRTDGDISASAANITGSTFDGRNLDVVTTNGYGDDFGNVANNTFAASQDLVVQGNALTGNQFSAEGEADFYTNTWTGSSANANWVYLSASTISGGSASASGFLQVYADTIDGMTLHSDGSATLNAYSALTNSTLSTGADGSNIHIGSADHFTYSGGSVDVWGQSGLPVFAILSPQGRPIGTGLVSNSSFANPNGAGVNFHNVSLDTVTVSTSGAMMGDNVSSIVGSTLTAGQFTGSLGNVSDSTINLTNPDFSNTNPVLSLINVGNLDNVTVNATGALDIEGTNPTMVVHNSRITGSRDNNTTVQNTNGSLDITGHTVIDSGSPVSGGVTMRASTVLNFGMDGEGAKAVSGYYIIASADTVNTGAGSLMQIVGPTDANENNSIYAGNSAGGSTTVGANAVFQADNAVFLQDGALVDPGASFTGRRDTTANQDGSSGILVSAHTALNLNGTLDTSTPPVVIPPPTGPGDGGTTPPPTGGDGGTPPPTGGNEPPVGAPPSDGGTPVSPPANPPSDGGGPVSPPSNPVVVVPGQARPVFVVPRLVTPGGIDETLGGTLAKVPKDDASRVEINEAQ
jgi:filamentous hemagglutinin family protein